jgi:cysteinyl-tRNA synthetase
MKIYNTITKKKEDFKPIKDNVVGIYSCGPTVYDYDHIGHAWKYFSDDILKRTFEYLGYKVNHVMNITDVGHLTSDADEGEDKLDKKAKKENKTPWEIAEFYTKIFFENSKKMNNIEADVICKATDYVKEMIAMNEILVKKGFAYESDDAVYFDITKFSDYGKLSGNTLENLKAGVRVEVNKNKKNPHDFVLWVKAIGEHENHAMVWDSPWGKGFPGWHLECSTMSTKHLGNTIDIHTGGEDNIFPHHECEIAQSESATGKKFVNYWMHTRFLMVDGTKMSKSLNNFYKIQNIEEKGFNPLALRFLFLQAHYRSQINFTWESLQAAQNGLDNLYSNIQNLGKDKGNIDEKFKNTFNETISDDFNMPKAFSLVQEVLKSNLEDKDKLATILDFDKVFGLKLDKIKEEKIDIPSEVQDLIEQRKKARSDGDYELSDQLRDQIHKYGFFIEDSDNEVTVRKK